MANAQPISQSNQVKPLSNESKEIIHVTVRNRNQVLFNGDATSVTSKNDTGSFDVLAEHSNFISLIQSPLIIRKTNGEKQEVTFKNGLLKVKDNSVHCYIDLLAQRG
jgi:F0F1-type ATP synthase epsilon subunit